MPFATLNNQEIFYQDSGGDGPPLVFMHGFLMDQAMFAPQVAALAPDYRCIRFDARAFGQTKWDGEAFTLYDTVADCIALLDHLDIEQATVIGMSQGGYAALRLALKHPDRLKALVLMSSRATADEDAIKDVYRETRDTWKNAGPLAPMVEGLMTAIIGPAEATQSLWDTWRPKWEAQSGKRIFHAMNNLIDRDDLTEADLKQIQTPTLIIHGEEDQGVPIHLGEALHQILPNSQGMVRVPGGAHAINLTHPEIVNPPLRDFLDQHA